MVKSCLLCGVGGQGTVLASKLIAAAAMEKGWSVRTAETIGMAQRGGSVVSHVRIGDAIASAMIPKHSADVLIGFEPGEAVRCLDYLHDGGTLIVNSKAVKPVTASLSKSDYSAEPMLHYLSTHVKHLHIIHGDAICEKCGSLKVLNTVLLACAAKTGALGISVEELKAAMQKRIPAHFLDLNLRAVSVALEE